jgi:hypothetical protein
MTTSFLKGEIAKVDAKLGLVFGWGIVCKVDGEEYFDTQGDHIPEAAMLKAAADFMENSRMSGDMHARDAAGEPIPDGGVVFSFPLTSDTAKAMGITSDRTGWMVAVKPSPEVLAKYESGEYTGFSIGGSRIRDEDVGELDKAYNPDQPREPAGGPKGGQFASTGGGGGEGGGGESGFGEGKVTLRTAFTDDGDPYTHIPNEKAYVANIVAAKYPSVKDFEEKTGATFAEAKGRWMNITNGTIEYYEDPDGLDRPPPRSWMRATEIVDLKTGEVVDKRDSHLTAA